MCRQRSMFLLVHTVQTVACWCSCSVVRIDRIEVRTIELVEKLIRDQVSQTNLLTHLHPSPHLRSITPYLSFTVPSLLMSLF